MGVEQQGRLELELERHHWKPRRREIVNSRASPAMDAG
jgi:hypothetical protein